MRLFTVFLLGLCGLFISPAVLANPESQALKFLDNNGGEWVTQKNCVSCHSSWSYGFARIGTPGWELSPVTKLESHIKGRLNRWAVAKPWYGSRGSQKAEESLATELIVSASLLAEIDIARGLTHTSANTNLAIKYLIDRQQTDGGFAWLDYNLQPLESAESRVFGNSLAMVTLARAKALNTYPHAIQKLATLLTKVGKDSSTALYYRMSVAWASVESQNVLNANEIQSLVTELYRLQHVDGGWSMNQFGPWSKKGNSPSIIANQSDANATAYALYILQRIQLSGSFNFITTSVDQAKKWLEKNQNADGSWDGFSVNSNHWKNHSHMQDLATGFATRSLFGIQ